MTFLKGLSSEDMDVRVMTSEEAPQLFVKEWERDFAKHLQSEVRLERFYSDED